MSKNTMKNLIAVIMCILFLSMFVFDAVIEFDIAHLLTCHDDHCGYCAVIHYAQNNISNLIIVILAIVFHIMIIYQSYKFLNKNYFISQTLIHSKVQLNI